MSNFLVSISGMPNYDIVEVNRNRLFQLKLER